MDLHNQIDKHYLSSTERDYNLTQGLCKSKKYTFRVM